MSYFVFQQGELHKSEKRAASSRGKLRIISTITIMLQCHSIQLNYVKRERPLYFQYFQGGCVTSSSGDFGSSYRPAQQLVLPAWTNWSERHTYSSFKMAKKYLSIFFHTYNHLFLKWPRKYLSIFFRSPPTPSFSLCQHTWLVLWFLNSNLCCIHEDEIISENKLISQTFLAERFSGNPGGWHEPTTIYIFHSWKLNIIWTQKKYFSWKVFWQPWRLTWANYNLYISFMKVKYFLDAYFSWKVFWQPWQLTWANKKLYCNNNTK